MSLLAAFVALTVAVMGGYLWWRLRSWDAPAIVACCGVGAWIAGVSLMGVPRPASHALLANWNDFEVISYQLEEGRAIYLWLRREQPIAYRLPWNENQARKLHEASQEAKEKHTPLRVKKVRRADDHYARGELTFYPEPVRPLPPKQTGSGGAPESSAGSRSGLAGGLR